MNKYQEALDEIGDDLKFLGEGGVLESTDWDNLQELVDRATPMKPIENHYEEKGQEPYIKPTCPRCEQLKNKRYALCSLYNYCPICGQALDWGTK